MFTDMTFWGPFLFASEWAIRLGMLAVVPMRRSPQAASAWLLLTLVSPLGGIRPLPVDRLAQNAALA